MKRSAGLLLFRSGPIETEVLLGHMGGPLWARKDQRAWSIPKGIVDASDPDEWAAAQREFVEEMGQPVPSGPTIDLGVFRQNRDKEIHIWACAGDLDATLCSSIDFELEWPPGSGRVRSFPEIDRAGWFGVATARSKLIAGQVPVLDALLSALVPAPPDLPDLPAEDH